MDKVRNQEIDKQAVLEIFRYFKNTFDSQPVEERKELIRLTVKDVTFDAKNDEIRLSFYSMPPETSCHLMVLITVSNDGGGRIRTSESLTALPVFKTGALNLYATPPYLYHLTFYSNLCRFFPR